MKVAEQVIDMAKFLLRCSSGGPLIKQLFEHIMFNPKLWINSDPSVQVGIFSNSSILSFNHILSSLRFQVHLYNYLATDFLGNTNFHHIIRQVATFGEMCHALKFYYWVTMPKPPSAYQVFWASHAFPFFFFFSILYLFFFVDKNHQLRWKNGLSRFRMRMSLQSGNHFLEFIGTSIRLYFLEHQKPFWFCVEWE